MDGRGKAADLSGDLARYAAPLPGVLINASINGLRRPLILSKGFEPLQPGFTGTVGPGAVPNPPFPSGLFGPELSFGHAMATALPDKHLLLIKYAEGGTNLQKDWNPKQPDKLYQHFIEFVHSSQKTIESQGDTFVIRGLLWHQGESDAGQPIGSYKNSLTAFINSARSDLGVPKLPILIGQEYNNGKRDNIFADQKTIVGTMPETYLVESAGLETWDHGTHFDAKSQIELGKRFAGEMLKHLP